MKINYWLFGFSAICAAIAFQLIPDWRNFSGWMFLFASYNLWMSAIEPWKDVKEEEVE